MEQEFELQIHSIAVGSARNWALYAVPTFHDEPVERVECRGIEELDVLLTRLRRIGVLEPALLKARQSIMERNVSHTLGSFVLSIVDRALLRLEPVQGLTAGDINHLPLGEYEDPST